MENMYLQAQREWDERFAFHARQAKIATTMAIILALLSIALGGIIVWQAMHRTYVPYVVMVDDLGRPALANPPLMVSDWPDAVILREVSESVERLRAIPADEVALKAAWKKLLLYTVPGTAAYRKIAERGQSKVNSPFVLHEQLTIEVEMRSVLFQGGKTWLAEWSEITREHPSGRPIKTARYNGSFQLGQLEQRSPEILTVNPLGVQIQDFDIRLIGEEQ